MLVTINVALMKLLRIPVAVITCLVPVIYVKYYRSLPKISFVNDQLNVNRKKCEIST